MLILLFSLKLDLLPVSGKGDWTTYILPSLTIATALAAALSRMTRNSMLDTMREDASDFHDASNPGLRPLGEGVGLCQDGFHDSTVNVGQAEVAARVAIRQLLVVEAHQVQHGRV